MKQRNRLVVICTVVLFAGSFAAAYGLLVQAEREQQLLQHTHLVIEQLKGVLSCLRSGESAERGYLNTGDRSFLQPYYRAIVRLPNIVNSLVAQLSANPLQEAKLARLSDLIQQKLQWEEQLLSTYEQAGQQKAAELQQTHTGLKLTNDINELVNEMEAAENAILISGQHTYAFTNTWLGFSLLLLSILGLLFLTKAISFERKSLLLGDQKQAVLQQLEALNHDLNQQVKDLLQTREDLAKALAVRSEFLANVSHELRTPLTGVISSTDLVLSMPLIEEQRHLIEIAKNCGEELLRLVDDILDFARIESHNLSLKCVDFDLANTIREALEPLSQRARLKALQFNLRVAEDIPSNIIGDATRTSQVLINLVDNAIKFTEKGTVTVSVARHWEDSSHVSIRFIVSDTGIGIDSGKLDVIFGRFVQVDSSTTRHYGGVGLGLAITRSLVELMKGKIEVSSTPGVGSQFSVIIPYTKPAQCAEDSSPAPLESRTPAQPIQPILSRWICENAANSVSNVAPFQKKKQQKNNS